MIAALMAVLALAVPRAGDGQLTELQGKLGGSDVRARRAAVQELAKLGSLEAWKLVIGVLGDMNAQVADEAQLQIAKIADPKVRALLLGKDGAEAKDPWVRVRVAEALAHSSGELPLGSVSTLLRDKETSVRRTFAWTLERLQRAGALQDALGADRSALAVVRAAVAAVAAKEKDAETRAAQLVAHGVLGGPLTLAAADELLGDKEPAVRAAAALLAQDAPPEIALHVVRGLALDKHVGARIASAELAARVASKPAARALVDALERESEPVARWRDLDLLRALSGQKMGLNPKAWRAWVDGLAEDWTGTLTTPEELPDAERSVAFVGLPIRSGRVVFLVDLSGSVWEKRADGKTKKQRIDVELARALRALPEGTEFNLIPYTSKPIPWEKGLVRADKTSVEKALAFFDGRKDSGTGNFWDALELALEDPRVDNVIVLTDGAPTGGRRWNLGLMRELFVERNRFRRVVLDAILADAPRALTKEWLEMCASSGGRVVEVDWR
ncbi:MAG: hypothetical protein IT454_23455 [Planctomycetes bacterium]|nr:hypothetical protein [Planctomycetota bacterium]